MRKTDSEAGDVFFILRSHENHVNHYPLSAWKKAYYSPAY